MASADLKEAVRRRLIAHAAAGETTTYAALVEAVPGLDVVREAGALGPLLREISLEEHAAGRGLLSAVVTRTDGGLPGAGFFDLARSLGRATGHREECWRAEVERVFSAHGH